MTNLSKSPAWLISQNLIKPSFTSFSFSDFYQSFNKAISSFLQPKRLISAFALLSGLTYSQVIFNESFNANLGTMMSSGGTNANWIFTNSCGRSSMSGHSGTGSAIFSGSACYYGNGIAAVSGNMTSPALNIPNGGGSLSFKYGLENECGNSSTCLYDALSVGVSNDNGATFTLVASSMSEFNANSGWDTFTLSLNAYANSAVLIRFRFDSFDGTDNIHDGAYLDDIIVTANCIPPILLVKSNLLVFCVGDTALLTASGASSYTWMPGNLTGSIVTINPLANTIYTVTGINGCASTETLQVLVNPKPLVFISNANVCLGSSYTFNPSGAASYIYSSGSPVASPVQNTTYLIQGISALGCKSTPVSVNLTVKALPSVLASASKTDVCISDAPVQLAGTPAGGMFSGQFVNTTVFSASVANTYVQTYYYTDPQTTCSNSATSTIKVNVCAELSDVLFHKKGISVFPNPTSNNIIIQTYNNHHKQISISDLSGRVVLNENSDIELVQVNVIDWPNGFYFVRVVMNGKSEMVKLVKE